MENKVDFIVSEGNANILIETKNVDTEKQQATYKAYAEKIAEASNNDE